MNVEFRRLDAVGVGAILVAVGVAAVAYPHLPARIAIHWDAAGRPDGYASRLVGLAIPVALVAGLYVLHRFVPSVDPLSSTLRQTPWYDGFVALLLAFLVYVELLIVAWNLDLVAVAVGTLLVPPLAAVYYGVGALLERVDRNAIVGVRTPWTLASEPVWEATHDRAAPAFKLAAVATLPGVASEGPHAVGFAVGPVLLAAAYAVGYSFLAYRRLEGRAG